MPLKGEDHVYRSPIAPLGNTLPVRSFKMTRYRRLVSEILQRSERLKAKTDTELRELSEKYHKAAIDGKALDDLLPKAFALVRETSRRVLGMAHYPVQLLGGIGIHTGHIVQMATGEGKTLVATCPSYLNALTDRGVHVVTVNDYLAQRDADIMGQVHRFLGLTVGVITSDASPAQRAQAYRASITYGTNKEFGFDFLRDELRVEGKGWFPFGRTLDELRIRRVQRREFAFAIVDEADSVLIDEARTPLIISSAPPADDELTDEMLEADLAAREILPLEDAYYTFDRKEKKIEWLRAGEQQIQRMLGGRLSLGGHRIDWHESVMRALKAHLLFHRDVEYVVDDEEIVIVDENTGRKMPGRQWEGGLHQAVAAKEKQPIKGETETLARTTYQIYFNRYEKLAGMTGTAMTDAHELAEIYSTPVLPVPTNRPCIRKHLPDRIYGSESAKWDAVAERVREAVAKGHAVLIGTRSIEKSEVLSERLLKAGVDHVVLNARHEAQEAKIVADAGQPGRVTVATNMAGRGTDIKLHEEVAAAGGLYVIGTERHESRRVDNQLAGRAGRQGDPGTAIFMLSVEDPLIRRYRPRASARLMKRYGSSSKPIRGQGIRRFFQRVQLTIERQHRKIRYQLIKHDRKRIEYNRELGTA